MAYCLFVLRSWSWGHLNNTQHSQPCRLKEAIQEHQQQKGNVLSGSAGMTQHAGRSFILPLGTLGSQVPKGLFMSCRGIQMVVYSEPWTVAQLPPGLQRTRVGGLLRYLAGWLELRKPTKPAMLLGLLARGKGLVPQHNLWVIPVHILAYMLSYNASGLLSAACCQYCSAFSQHEESWDSDHTSSCSKRHFGFHLSWCTWTVSWSLH